jgi:dipeptidase E
MKILAISSSRVGSGGFLENAIPLISRFLGADKLHIAFLPFASVQRSYDDYGSMVKEALSSLSTSISTASLDTARSVIEMADVIMVGGGNTFKLLHDIYHHGLFQLLQNKIRTGTPYIGWSAGANLAGRSISTTNDMPVIQPKSFTAFGFFPFQINPHYINQTVERFHGETRDQRLEEFVVLNPGIPVIALPEGTALQLDGSTLKFLGNKDGALFRSDKNQRPEKTTIAKGEDLSSLLNASY